MQQSTKAIEWINDRWHCDGQPIHAGVGMELRGYDKQWFRVRIESADQGRRLIAYLNVHEMQFRYPIDPEFDCLRWP